ncbi:ankyrin repeat domain-containing protein [Sabulicella glaciei]|uniref:Ankyrin repeat domain-containing protein n=1 Tax=Sabulicella glaciei TaxID=2984948 RepID=A0ABT3NZS0_9PROT|nr:ankyrin repeat domain-containing protein [Roseococcus sp. MDT2-1-1]MCW8087656.1 ankyrin repeat domain-containing protein [Roseococcus sp. MDT2-1-1]
MSAIIDIKDESGCPAARFINALEQGFKGAARNCLADQNFDPNFGDGAVLRSTIKLGYLDLIDDVLSKGANPNLACPDRRTALFFALENEYFDVAETLLRNGAEISARDKFGWTPLIWASIKGYPRIVEFLVEKGADLHICSEDGWNALTGAFFKQHQFIVDYLTKHGARFGRKYKEAALLSAYQYGAYHVVRQLIQDGVNVNIGSSDGEPLLISVLHRGDADILQLLLDAGADMNMRDKEGNPALLSAIHRAQYRLASTLVQSGASVNVKGPYWAPIHIAAERGQLELCRILLAAGAAVDQLGHDGHTALMRACQQKHLDVVELLLSQGADPNLRQKEEKSSLALAGYGFRTLSDHQNSIIRLLMERGAKP